MVRDHTADACIEWTISAPDMTPQNGVFWFQSVNGAISVVEDATTIQTFNARRTERNGGFIAVQ
jgi:hypothetical protein